MHFHLFPFNSQIKLLSIPFIIFNDLNKKKDQYLIYFHSLPLFFILSILLCPFYFINSQTYSIIDYTSQYWVSKPNILVDDTTQH
jgi:hypothetical protein